MPGQPQPKTPRDPRIAGEVHVPTEDEAIALAVAMCEPGQAIEMHDPDCACIPCTCTPTVIVPGRRGAA